MGKQLSRAERQLDQLRDIRDKMYLKGMERLSTVLDVPDYDEDIDPREVTPEEVQKWGSVAEAQRRKRMIRDFYKCKKDVPVYIQETREMVNGLARMIAKDGATGGDTLNIAVFIQNDKNDPLPEMPRYGVIDIDTEEQD